MFIFIHLEIVYFSFFLWNIIFFIWTENTFNFTFFWLFHFFSDYFIFFSEISDFQDWFSVLKNQKFACFFNRLIFSLLFFHQKIFKNCVCVWKMFSRSAKNAKNILWQKHFLIKVFGGERFSKKSRFSLQSSTHTHQKLCVCGQKIDVF